MAIEVSTLSAASQAALAQLRDPATFNWSPVYLLVLTQYLYVRQLRDKRSDVVAAGLAVWFADWINEILNSALMCWTGKAPLWAETGRTSYQILVGLNAETTLLFLLFGMSYAMLLPKDPRARILGINNRLLINLGLSIACVVVEVVLNRIGVLNWYWPFWNVPYGLPVIVVFGYMWFFLAAAWVHDAPTAASRWRRVATLGGTAALLAVVFGGVGWL
jgi:hypothetical protein